MTISEVDQPCRSGGVSASRRTGVTGQARRSRITAISRRTFAW